MLIAFVLLGRNLEQRAKIKASSDMTELLSIVPSKARLLVNDGEQELESVVEVSTNSLSVGDKIVVLPGVSMTPSCVCYLMFCIISPLLGVSMIQSCFCYLMFCTPYHFRMTISVIILFDLSFAKFGIFCWMPLLFCGSLVPQLLMQRIK